LLSPKQFDLATNIHFVSPEGLDVGSCVYADCIVPHPGGTSFYFGRSCVAILSQSYLIISTRQLERSALRNEKPFWYDSAETIELLPAEHPLRATA